MNTKTSTFDIDEQTFNEAMKYMRLLSELLSVSLMSELLFINRATLSASLNGTKDKRKQPNKLPKKHWHKVVKFVTFMQFDKLMKMLAEEGSGATLSELWKKKIAEESSGSNHSELSENV